MSADGEFEPGEPAPDDGTFVLLNVFGVKGDRRTGGGRAIPTCSTSLEMATSRAAAGRLLLVDRLSRDTDDRSG
jgi:hypothetical protein